MSGFVAAPGTNFSTGDEPEITKRLNQLAMYLGVTIYGISGYRTPQHSVAVGGSANDPHTQGKAADIGVNSQLRSSAGQITDDELALVGLKRPYPGATEINHIELADSSSGPLDKAAQAVKGGVNDVFNGQAIASGVKGANSLINQGEDAVAGAGADAAGSVAQATGKAIVGDVVDSLGQNGARVALSIALVLAALVAITFGLSRAFGLHAPASLKTAAKAAAVA